MLGKNWINVTKRNQGKSRIKRPKICESSKMS